ncbi:MAG: insulinase family protein, partial [Actinomycetes bacterium]
MANYVYSLAKQFSDFYQACRVLQEPDQATRDFRLSLTACVKQVLANGLTLLRCHRPGQQVVAVEINLAAPLDAEPEGLDGVATIMARALSEGTDKHSAEEFAAELERCGATLDAHADHPGIRVSLEVPASRLAKALGLLAEALRAPAFADSEVDRLVRNRLDEIPHELANPQRRAAKQLSQELFPATLRMSRPRQGTEETVARIDSAAVRAFYEAHVRPATATAVVVGDLTGIDLDAVLADTLGPWTGGTAAPLPVPAITADDTGRVVIVDRPGAVQTQLLIGRIGGDRHDRVWAAQVLGTYCLGGTLTSRLDKVLREEKGYTYGAYSFFNASIYPGAFRASTQVRNDVTDGSMHELMYEFKRIRDEAVPAKELTEAQHAIVAQFALSLESPQELLNYWLTSQYYG